jgi:hypothetical protein
MFPRTKVMDFASLNLRVLGGTPTKQIDAL